jgi:hypothetical protein
MAVEVSSGSRGIDICLRSGTLSADFLRADRLRADRGEGPSLVGFSLEFMGSSISLIRLRFQTLNFNFEFQTSFCLKFLLLQTQVFAKRVSSCLDGLLLQHRYCKANFLFLPVLMVCLRKIMHRRACALERA